MSACPELDEFRQRLQATGLSRSDLASDPMEQFQRWFDEAISLDIHEPDAMVVSTVGRGGRPSSRYVLLRGVDGGFVFFTNYESRKGAELAHQPVASICFPWHVLSRQVRAIGRVEQVSAAESDAYFAGRPRDSQVSAWASRQSDVIDSRAELEARVAESEARFEGREVPRPPHWGGYRVVPDEFEFWQGRRSRLHDRFRYLPDASEPSGWRIDRLNP
ncbi:MAG TPA: pyridoxamine 5'-phosphate oxidase [Acidimicrobiales bacterium]